MSTEKKREESRERREDLSEHDDRYKGTIPARELLRALWPYLRPHRGRLGVTLLATALLAGARIASLVAGTRAPVVLTSRADDDEFKFASICLAARLASKRFYEASS